MLSLAMPYHFNNPEKCIWRMAFTATRVSAARQLEELRQHKAGIRALTIFSDPLFANESAL
jgi:hypothetical protein